MEIEQQVELEDDAEERRDAALLKLLRTPPKPRPKREQKQAALGKAESVEKRKMKEKES